MYEELAPIAPADVARALSARPGLAWLDSDGSNSIDARFSYVACDPVDRVVATRTDDLAAVLAHLAPLAGWRARAPGERCHPRWIGYLAYDAVWSDSRQWLQGASEQSPRIARPSDRPVVCFQRYDAAYAFDHAEGRAFVVGDDVSARARLRERMATSSAGTPWLRARVTDVTATDAARHERSVARAIELIHAGDLYQVNLARRWRGRFEGHPLALSLAMRAASEVPLGFSLDAGGEWIHARTMERFLGSRGDRLVTRPIKGTIARRGEDVAERGALLSDEKEIAEHSMIVDLMRNDLTRFAVPGTIQVDEALSVEPYRKLHHLVSTISAKPRDGTTLEAILGATFPPGSVTGAPKIRAVELIEELEEHPRHVYCGAVGFIDAAGLPELAVAIRTAVTRADVVEYFAGGGIVWRSDAAREVAETELKARAFLDAVAHLG